MSSWVVEVQIWLNIVVKLYHQEFAGPHFPILLLPALPSFFQASPTWWQKWPPEVLAFSLSRHRSIQWKEIASFPLTSAEFLCLPLTWFDKLYDHHKVDQWGLRNKVIILAKLGFQAHLSQVGSKSGDTHQEGNRGTLKLGKEDMTTDYWQRCRQYLGNVKNSGGGSQR